VPGDHLADFLSSDGVIAALGVEVLEVGPDRVEVSLVVAGEHTDHCGVLSAGVAFTVGDTAIALASNAEGAVALLIHAEIEWWGAVAVGDRLAATCLRTHRQGHDATFESRLTAGDGTLAGIVRGRTRSPRR
jgi:acyl-CoA thioesterase